MDSLNVSVLTSLPPVDEAGVDALLAAELARDPHKLVVLDDDPTGVQTIHSVSVYTDWSLDSVRAGFAEENKLFYILTNSRGMTVAETAALHRAIADTVTAVSKECGKPYLFLSRSDSTLRGHYPLETQLLRSVKISDGVQSLVARLSVAPAFVIAKGGITSSDVGVKALRVKCATVMGQICPGIPVWQTGPESRFPQTPYVIFPGNTGSEATLREAVEILNGNA